MKPEPLPGARFTVSESRRGGATQGHAYNERQPRLRLARRAAPLQLYMKSATAIGVVEAIMVSKWELLETTTPMYTRTPSGRPTTRRCSVYLGKPVRSLRVRSNRYRWGYTRGRLETSASYAELRLLFFLTCLIH